MQHLGRLRSPLALLCLPHFALSGAGETRFSFLGHSPEISHSLLAPPFILLWLKHSRRPELSSRADSGRLSLPCPASSIPAYAAKQPTATEEKLKIAMEERV